MPFANLETGIKFNMVTIEIKTATMNERDLCFLGEKITLVALKEKEKNAKASKKEDLKSGGNGSKLKLMTEKQIGSLRADTEGDKRLSAKQDKSSLGILTGV